MNGIDARHGSIEDETRGRTSSVTSAVTVRVFRFSISLLKLHASFHLHQLNVVVGGTLAGTSGCVVRMQVCVRLRRTDVIDGMNRVVTTGDGLCHSRIVGVHGGSRDRAHCRDRVTSSSHLWDGGNNRRRLDIGIKFSTLDKIVNRFFNLYPN
jgi:hypothetical protein